MEDQINLFFELLELSNTGYTVSVFRHELNEIVTDINFDNRQIKNLLMNYFSGGICFTYPNDRKKMQMFFLRIFVLQKMLNPFAVKQMTM